jgi:hypothetical protein
MAGGVGHGVGTTRVGAYGAELVGVAHGPVVTAGDHGDVATEGEVSVFVGEGVAGAREQLVLVMLVPGATGVQRFGHCCDDRGRAVDRARGQRHRAWARNRPLTVPIRDVPGIERDYLDFMPLGRSGTPEEIAGAAVYISRARWLTGEVLDLNGCAHFV